MSSPIRISIIMACRSEARHIHEVIRSLEAQQFDGWAWEALIADGMSTDGTREFLEQTAERNPHIRVIANPGRIVSTGLNSAIRAARGEFIVRMDAHTSYAPDYCRRSVEVLLETGADNAGGAARTRVTGRMPRAVAAAYHSRFSTGGAPFHRPEFEGWADTVPYGCWRKTKLIELGLFDENLVRNQDDELNLRLLRAGGRIWQSPRILSWYSPRPNPAALARQYSQYGFWKVAVIRKHRLPGSVRHLVPVFFVAANLALPLAALALALAGVQPAALRIFSVWSAMLLVYFAATFAASIVAAREHGWDLLPALPLIFATFHFSYGTGFALGLLQSPPAAGRPAAAETFFARITR